MRCSQVRHRQRTDLIACQSLPVRIEGLPVTVSHQNQYQLVFLRRLVNLDLRNFGRWHGLYRLTVAGDVKPDNRQQNTGAAAQ